MTIMTNEAPFFACAEAAPRDNSHSDGRLLVVEDEADIAALLATGLRFVGFDVRAVHTGADALAAVSEFRPDVLVLDVMLPDITGFELCRQIRRDNDQIGVLFLTARDRTEDAIVGLTVGGDDYISKPFSLDEVVARIRSVMRRATSAPATANVAANRDGVLRFADLELDEVRHEVRRGDTFIELSPTEFSLLRYLLENSGRVVSKAQILAHVWSYDFRGGATVVESYISYLRKKIDCFEPSLIHTFRGIGYSLRVAHTGSLDGER
jgi:two-component system, OmpR family, response regulator